MFVGECSPTNRPTGALFDGAAGDEAACYCWPRAAIEKSLGNEMGY